MRAWSWSFWRVPWGRLADDEGRRCALGCVRDACHQGPPSCDEEERRSGDERYAPVGVEQLVGGRPFVEDAHEAASGAVHDAGGCVPQRPAQAFRVGRGEFSVEAEQLEPADEIGREAHHGEPCPVGVDIGEREPQQARIFEAGDVVLDVGVGAHVGVEGDRVASLVGVVAPSSETRGSGTGWSVRQDGAARAAR